MVPPWCLRAHFEATFYFSRIANLLAHNNLWLYYYVQVNSLLLKSLRNGQVNTFGVPLFSVDGASLITYIKFIV